MSDCTSVSLQTRCAGNRLIAGRNMTKFRTNMQKYNSRHCCQVGITGWAQINGLRRDTSISDRLRYDLSCIHNWSLALDLRIIARTVFAILSDQNAY